LNWCLQHDENLEDDATSGTQTGRQPEIACVCEIHQITSRWALLWCIIVVAFREVSGEARRSESTEGGKRGVSRCRGDAAGWGEGWMGWPLTRDGNTHTPDCQCSGSGKVQQRTQRSVLSAPCANASKCMKAQTRSDEAQCQVLGSLCVDKRYSKSVFNSRLSKVRSVVVSL